MLHGKQRTFFPDSRVTLGGSYAQQPARIVECHRKDKTQWLCELMHPSANKKRVLVHDSLLTFDGYVATDVELQVPSHLSVEDAGTPSPLDCIP